MRRDRQSDADEGLDCRRLCLLLLRLLDLASLRARFSFRRFFSFRSFRLRLRSFSCGHHHQCCYMCNCTRKPPRRNIQHPGGQQAEMLLAAAGVAPHLRVPALHTTQSNDQSRVRKPRVTQQPESKALDSHLAPPALRPAVGGAAAAVAVAAAAQLLQQAVAALAAVRGAVICTNQMHEALACCVDWCICSTRAGAAPMQPLI